MPDKIDAVDNLNFVSQYCPTKFAPMIVVGLMTYLVSFQSGLGPIPWIVNSEVSYFSFIILDNTKSFSDLPSLVQKCWCQSVYRV